MKKSSILTTKKEWPALANANVPIFGQDIPRFRNWALFNGFRYCNLKEKEAEDHGGLDFISYSDGRDIFRGLAPRTPVRAIEKGRVFHINQTPDEDSRTDYDAWISIIHNEEGLSSAYCHVTPSVKIGESVEKGQIIGKMLEKGFHGLDELIHLHLEIGNCYAGEEEYSCVGSLVDPFIVIPGLQNLFKKYDLSQLKKYKKSY